MSEATGPGQHRVDAGMYQFIKARETWQLREAVARLMREKKNTPHDHHHREIAQSLHRLYPWQGQESLLITNMNFVKHLPGISFENASNGSVDLLHRRIGDQGFNVVLI